MWYYACQGTLLRPKFCDHHNAFRGSLLINSLWAHVVFKRFRVGNDTIHPKLLTVELVRWSKLPGGQQLKRPEKKNLCLQLFIETYWRNWAIGLMSSGFTNGLGDRGSIPGRVIPKTQKWYLMPPWLELSIIR